MATEKDGDTLLSEVTADQLQELIELFAVRLAAYKAYHSDQAVLTVEQQCQNLISRDYDLEIIENSDGQLCLHYPANLFILNERGGEKTYQTGELKGLFKAAKRARCRFRFPVPVIVIGQKNICRSATISTTAELYGRSALEWIISESYKCKSGHEEEHVPQDGPRERKPAACPMVDQARHFDCQLLKLLNVELLCDLMVENRTIKYGVIVSSSEKADGRLWYSEFSMLSIPYPGCEFFEQYRQKKGKDSDLIYDWNLPMNDADISVPSSLLELVSIDFEEYKTWNIYEITQNYLKLILAHLQNKEGGVLIHCVSGWDRTPLFISLLRLSLWADGHIHKSLEPIEILYLTLAYDWFLFGHQFKSKLRKREEILYFCFDFLEHIVSDEFKFHLTPPSSTPTKAAVEKGSDMTGSLRAQRLRIVRDLFLGTYGEAIPEAKPKVGGLWGAILERKELISEYMMMC